MQDYISEPTHHVKVKTHSPPHNKPHPSPDKDLASRYNFESYDQPDELYQLPEGPG